MAPPGRAPGEVWQYYLTQNGVKFKSDKSHKAAWCKACFNASANNTELRNQALRFFNPGQPEESQAAVEQHGT